MPTLARRACWLSRGVRKSGKVQTIRIVNYLAVRRNIIKGYDLKEPSEPNCLLKVKPPLSWVGMLSANGKSCV
jgi:hypothetical protein